HALSLLIRWRPFRKYVPFFFIAAPPTDIYPRSLHDALPILMRRMTSAESSEPVIDWLTATRSRSRPARCTASAYMRACRLRDLRSEEHTSELQSRGQLVCRLLPEKKKAMDSLQGLTGRASHQVLGAAGWGIRARVRWVRFLSRAPSTSVAAPAAHTQHHHAARATG